MSSLSGSNGPRLSRSIILAVQSKQLYVHLALSGVHRQQNFGDENSDFFLFFFFFNSAVREEQTAARAYFAVLEVNWQKDFDDENSGSFFFLLSKSVESKVLDRFGVFRAVFHTMRTSVSRTVVNNRKNETNKFLHVYRAF